MSAAVASPLDRAKERLNVADIGAQIFPGWKTGRSCRSPFREDRHASFSVFDDGRKWKDHATGEGGDVVDFLALARGISKSDAARELIAMSGTTGPTTRQPMPIPSPRREEPTAPQERAPRAILPAMPEACQAIYDEGVDHLQRNTSLQQVLDQWRSWPAGTVGTLAADGVIGCPVLNGRRGIAFPVQWPYLDELGIVTLRSVGFHHRHKPANTQDRAKWSYRPNEREDGGSVPSLPFVLGAGFAPYATTILVAEGQWDAITLAAAAGWLASDAAWPERITIFATRGAGAWRPLIDAWAPFWSPGAAFVLFQDADESGDKWRAPGGFAATLRARGHRVRTIRSKCPDAKDLNALHQHHGPLTPAMITRWIDLTGANTA